MHLFQVRFAFELLVQPLLLRTQSSYQREDDRESHSSSFLAQDELRHDSPVLLDFLQIIDFLHPPGWSVIARDQLSGWEQSLGYWWPLSRRPHEFRLPGARSVTVHLFAGAREGATASMIIRWQEPHGLVNIEWTFPDRTIDTALLSPEQAQAGQLDEAIRLRLPRLMPM